MTASVERDLWKMLSDQCNADLDRSIVQDITNAVDAAARKFIAQRHRPGDLTGWCYSSAPVLVMASSTASAVALGPKGAVLSFAATPKPFV